MNLVPESLNEANFERGANSRKQIIDRILDRIITVEIDAHNIVLDENGNFDTSNEETKYFLDNATSRGAKIELADSTPSPYGVMIKMTGTKKQLMPALHMWDPSSRDLEDFESDMEGWKGSEDDLWDFIDPDY